MGRKWLVLLFAAFVGIGCGSDGSANGDGGTNGDGGGGGDGGAGDGGGGGLDAGGGPCVPSGPQCNNCVDDDGDGLIDGDDPECISSLDNDESSFATGLPGDNVDPNWQDCFFDGDSGHGNDGCRYHTCCLYGTCTPGSAEAMSCTNVSQECIDNCQGATPPGCDCFGCCTVCDNMGCVDVVILPGCDYENLRDETKCPPCTQTTECGNPCEGQCVLCPGQLPEDLPPECGGMNECPGGEQTCTQSSECGEGQWCSNGCCINQIG